MVGNVPLNDGVQNKRAKLCLEIEASFGKRITFMQPLHSPANVSTIV